MPALEMINERFARLFHQSLYNLLRRSPEISVSQVTMKKFNDYVNTLHMPTNINVVRINPLRGMGLVVLDPKLVFTAVDNLFGGIGRHAKVEGRDFTATEQRIMQAAAASRLRQPQGGLVQGSGARLRTRPIGNQSALCENRQSDRDRRGLELPRSS